jgi:hypothetical protein
MRVLCLLLVGLVLAACVVYVCLCYLDSGFKDSVSHWFSGARQETNQAIQHVKAEMTSDQLTAIRRAARSMAARCEDLAHEHLNDAQTLIGIAFIYRQFPNRKCTYQEAVERAWAASPTNPVALAMKSELDNTTMIAKLKASEACLDGLIKSQKVRGLAKPLIGPDDALVYALVQADDSFVTPLSSVAGGSKPVFAIDDTAKGQAILTERMKAFLPDLLKEIEYASSMDPNNGLYDYMKARVLFEMGSTSEAIVSIKKAISKPQVTDHFDLARGEAMKVMASERYPRACQDYMGSVGSSAGSFVALYICRDWLDNLSKKSRLEGNSAAAEELAALSELARKQCGLAQPARIPKV